MTNEEAINIVNYELSEAVCRIIEKYGDSDEDMNEWAELIECARDMATDALEKQIPQKPIAHKGRFEATLRCPICNCHVELSDGVQLGYCENCGQKIDWGGDEHGEDRC